MLGALDVVGMNLITVSNDSYINSHSVCELLEKLAKQATMPVTVVLDNARYQRCSLVQQTAKRLGIELLFVPPYSPNLNLIERLWKWTKSKCLAARVLKDFEAFREAIDDCLSRQFRDSTEELRSLLTCNFQSFEDLQTVSR